jgi:hypothetical protein
MRRLVTTRLGYRHPFELADGVGLVVSELVTSAIAHSGGTSKPPLDEKAHVSPWCAR